MGRRLRLALNLGYQAGPGDPAGDLTLAREAEKLGFSGVWVAEAYGSDAPTMLSWLAAQTSTVDIGSAVMQIAARTPAMTAMTTATLDLLSGGRFRLGLGVSGPQVSEGWHGARFDAPLERTREYVELVRSALRREPLTGAGRHYPLPLPGGRGRTLRLTLHPPRARVPLYLGAVGPRNLALCGEIADGWLGAFYSPEHAGEQLGQIRAGRRRAGLEMAGFDVAPTVPVVFGDDVDVCAATVRPYAALYVGGMGSRTRNFYLDNAERMGHGPAARRVQELYLTGRRAEAAAAVPLALIDDTSLLGPPERIADRLHAFADSGATTLLVSLRGGRGGRGLRTMRRLAETLDAAGLG